MQVEMPHKYEIGDHVCLRLPKRCGFRQAPLFVVERGITESAYGQSIRYMVRAGQSIGGPPLLGMDELELEPYVDPEAGTTGG